MDRNDEESYLARKQMSNSLIVSSQIEDDCLHCEKSNFEGMKEEIRRRKEMLSLSVHDAIKTEKSFVRPSRFTQEKVNRTMSSGNRNQDHFQENFRTPIRKSLNFKPKERSQYGGR